MLMYDDIFAPLQNVLSDFLKVDVIQAESMGDKPPYPFVTIKKLSGPKSLGPPRESIDENRMKTIAQDVELTYSITVNAAIIEDAEDTALKAQLYLEGKGRERLVEHNIVVVEVMEPENRDVFLTVDYERRVGLDIKIRSGWSDTYPVETIDELIIGGE